MLSLPSILYSRLKILALAAGWSAAFADALKAGDRRERKAKGFQALGGGAFRTAPLLCCPCHREPGCSVTGEVLHCNPCTLEIC